MVDTHLSPDDMADYWAPDTTPDTVERVETHVFACASCARQLAAAHAAIEGIRDAVRRGQFQAIVSDAVLNQLARDGTRMRTFTVRPGDVVPCAVWAGDQVIVTRMRGDFTGLEEVTLVTEVDGREHDRVVGVPVGPGAKELITAFPAAQLAQLPQARVRLTIRAGESLVGEYILEHGGALAHGGADD